VQALRAVERYLPCEQLYVLGTNCVDNGKRAGLDKFLRTASDDAASVLHYEFMQVRAPFISGAMNETCGELLYIQLMQARTCRLPMVVVYGRTDRVQDVVD
jgi:hypothetical protein